MNIDQAFSIVAQAAQAASLPYQTHMQVQEALKMIAEQLKKESSNG
jgi:hypothetical protein